MNFKGFEDAVREMNLMYREQFGYIPSIRLFSCTQEEYLRALKKAVTEHIELHSILVSYGKPLAKNKERK